MRQGAILVAGSISCVAGPSRASKHVQEKSVRISWRDGERSVRWCSLPAAAAADSAATCRLAAAARRVQADPCR